MEMPVDLCVCVCVCNIHMSTTFLHFLAVSEESVLCLLPQEGDFKWSSAQHTCCSVHSLIGDPLLFSCLIFRAALSYCHNYWYRSSHIGKLLVLNAIPHIFPFLINDPCRRVNSNVPFKLYIHVKCVLAFVKLTFE